MRIIAGIYKGRPIEAPAGLDTRPTTDRVRESIMSSLFSLTGGFDGLHVLDAFAGSGAMGIEALSRGASDCTFNDFAKASRDAISQNIARLRIPDTEARVTPSDILAAGIPSAAEPFDLVFLDPPYATPADEVLAIIKRAFDDGAIADDGIVVYEHSERLSDDAVESFGLRELQSKRYGKTFVTYISK